MINVGMVAGSVGFTWIWDPQANQGVNIPSLTGFACTMNARLASSQPAAYSEFPMLVAVNGLTASYVTQSSTDFPVGGVYDIVFTATKLDGTSFIAEPVRVKVAQGL